MSSANPLSESLSKPICVLSPGGIGDALFNFGLLYALHTHRQLPIVVSGNQEVFAFAKAAGWVTHVLDYDRVGFEFYRDPDVFAQNYSAVIDLKLAPRPGTPLWQQRILDANLPPIDLQALSLQPLGPEPNDLPSGPYLVHHPGSGSPKKNWPRQHWHTLLDDLAGEWGWEIVVITGEAESRCNAPVVPLGQTKAPWRVWENRPLAHISHLLAHAKAFAGHDTGLAHLCPLLGCPALTLYGPTDPVIWGWGAPSTTILHKCNKESDLDQCMPHTQNEVRKALILLKTHYAIDDKV